MLRLTRKLSPFPSRLLLLSFHSSPSTPPKPLQNPTTPPPTKPSLPLPLSLLRGGCHDASLHPLTLPLCPGCGVHMQDSDPNLPGFFSLPKPKPAFRHHPVGPAEDEIHASQSLKTGILVLNEDEERDGEMKPDSTVVCARCHSLRHYGRVKNDGAERLLPDFDFDRMLGRKIASSAGSRSIVMVVVDAADFDGSFPRKVVKTVSESIEENSDAWKSGEPGNVPRMVLVVTKIDLLPSSMSPTGLEYWVRQRAREGGAVKLEAVHLVSAVRGWGVRNLVEHVSHLTGLRGRVWAVGAQNAGKSTLINAMGRSVGGNAVHLTEASVPGTTLGVVRVEGVLGENAKLFDTPGILHPYQLLTRLTREEQKLVHIGKTLRPRTYRIKVGHSIHIAGLMRLDIEEASVESIYVTVWASPLLPLHMGKTENASTFVENHFGSRLQPPIGEKRVSELGKWVRRGCTIRADTWNRSSVDVAAAGLGWFAIGLNGEATFGIWTYDGIDIVLRNSIIPDRAEIFEVAGFTVSKILSEADRALGKQKSNKLKRLSDHEDKFIAESTLAIDTAQVLVEDAAQIHLKQN